MPDSPSPTPPLPVPCGASLTEQPGRCHVAIDSPLGPLRIVASSRGIAGIYLQDQAHPPAPEALGEKLETPSQNVFAARAARELGEYFAGHRTAFGLRLDAHGTEFQQRVWAELATIPCGQTRSYGELALALGERKLTRAVGSAVGRNPVSIVVPCHRVVGADGALTGYAGGLERKVFLLRLEGALPAAADTLF